MNASDSHPATWFRRHPRLSIAIIYGAFPAFALAGIWSERFFPSHLLLFELPILGTASIAALLYHLRTAMPPSKLERLGRILGGMFTFLVFWFAAVWCYFWLHMTPSIDD